MGMQHCWNCIDRCKLEYSKINLSLCHCVLDWPAICVRCQHLTIYAMTQP